MAAKRRGTGLSLGAMPRRSVGENQPPCPQGQDAAPEPRGARRRPLRGRSIALGAIAALALSSPAQAWSPPRGPSGVPDQINPPAEGELLPQAHGYIAQYALQILRNDGFAMQADSLEPGLLHLLAGLRYADDFKGTQKAAVKACVGAFGFDECTDLKSESWNYAGDWHYYNPGTGKGFNPGSLYTAAYWLAQNDVVKALKLIPGARIQADVTPSLKSIYPSALEGLAENFELAVQAALGSIPSDKSIGGRQGRELAMFYLGFASHFLQDITIVHHTFDEPQKNHNAYEDWANNHQLDPFNATSAGLYENDLPDPVLGFGRGDARRFGAYAANLVHSSARLANVEAKRYQQEVEYAIPLAERLQAGLLLMFANRVGFFPEPGNWYPPKDVVGRTPSGELLLFRGDGKGGWKTGSGEQVGAGWQAFDAIIDAGDFDRDGFADLVARKPDGALMLYQGDGKGGWKTGVGVEIGSGWQAFDQILGAGDFDGDRNPDLIARQPDGTLMLYQGNGQGGWLTGQGVAIGGGWQMFDAIIAPGDFSGDGKVDLLGRTPEGLLLLYRGDGKGGFLQGGGEQVGSGWNMFDTILSWKSTTMIIN